MEEYEQQIDELIKSNDINNWRLALEICRGLNEDAELIIATKCHAQEYGSNLRWVDFIANECNCTWQVVANRTHVTVTHKLTERSLISKYIISNG
jgi:hypothetical protein